MQGVQVQFLVRKLRSHILCSVVKKKESQNAQDMKSKNIIQEHREKSENL